MLFRSPIPVELRPEHIRNWKRHVYPLVRKALSSRGLVLMSHRHAPFPGETMLSVERLNNLQTCVETALAEGVPGDFIEAGVWRGGATILMRAVLAAYHVTDRTVWVADSFQGFPTRLGSIDAQGSDFTGGLGADLFRVDADEVRRNFSRYGLLDGQVQFVIGWFSETLGRSPISALAVLRVDCDLFQSTWDVLHALYPKVSEGGFVIVDDYGAFAECRRAVDQYRLENDITEPIEWIDDVGIYWRRTRGVTANVR